MKTRERRMIRGQVEARALTDAEKASGWIGALTGIIPLNTDSVVLRDRRLNNGQPFVERIAPKAFADHADVMGMAGHSDATLDAFAREGVNLTIVETATEIRYDALIPDTSAGRDLLQLAEKRILRGTSFEFEVGAEDKWERRSDGTAVRTVSKGKLLTVNPVVWPAYDDSDLSVSMRGARREGDARGNYLNSCGDDCLDWWDPTVTPDAKFANWALNRATAAISDSLEYLRAVAVMAEKKPDLPSGALADYARAELAAASANAKTLIDWLAANGAQVNPAALQRANEKLAEARTVAEPAPISADHDRERRARILQLSSC